MTPTRVRRRVGWGAVLRWSGTLLSLALLGWLIARQDWRELIAVASRIGLGGLLAALAFVVLRQLLNALRWYSLLRVQPVDLSLLGAIRLTFAGLFASNFLPTTIGGDVVRLGAVLEASDDRVAGPASLVLDRLVGMLSMLVFLPLGLPILVGLFMRNELAGTAGMAVVGLKRRIHSAWQRILQAIEPWRNSPSAIVQAFFVNWLAAGAYFMAVWLVALGIGIPVSYWQVAGATALTYYLTLLPLSINGYGLRELGVVAVYTQLGATTEGAAALALITRGLLWVTSFPGALFIGPVLADALSGSKSGPNLEVPSEAD